MRRPRQRRARLRRLLRCRRPVRRLRRRRRRPALLRRRPLLRRRRRRPPRRRRPFRRRHRQHLLLRPALHATTRRRHRPSTHRPPTAPPSHRRRRAPARLARTERPGRKPPPRRPAPRADIAARPFVRRKALRGGLPAPGRNAGARLIQIPIPIPIRLRPDRLAVGTLRRRAPVCGHGPGVSSYGRAMLLPRAAVTPPARALAARAIRMTNWHQKRPFNDISNRYVAKYTARASTLVPKRGCLSSLVTVPLWPGFFLSAPARRRPSRARAAAAVRRHS
ncbi:hypothetical protein FEP47_03961 [Burkholderia multivorans]|nr:hypothetical protein [Burkholderia multivorans]